MKKICNLPGLYNCDGNKGDAAHATGKDSKCDRIHWRWGRGSKKAILQVVKGAKVQSYSWYTSSKRLQKITAAINNINFKVPVGISNAKVRKFSKFVCKLEKLNIKIFVSLKKYIYIFR